MIYEQALRRELAYTTGAVFLVLITIMITTLVIRILGFAANGAVNPQDVIVLIMLAVIGYIAVILSVSIFIAILIVLIRWHRDSEMVVWYASGLNLKMLYKPVLGFAMPWLIVITCMALFAWPWSNSKTNELSQKFKGRDEVSMIVAGKFFESANSNRVFFIESVDNISNKIKNVFVTDYKNNRVTVAMAESGFINNQLDGSKQIKIQHGNRYEGQPSQGDFKILEFDEYIVEIDKKPSPLIKPSAKETPTIDLINYPIPLAQGELLWRIGLPLMAFGLIMLAVPLAYVNPRKGSYIAMLYAVFFYLIYSNLLNITQSLVSESKRSFLTTFWPIHVLAMILALLLLMYRMNPSIPWWQRFIPGGSRGS